MAGLVRNYVRALFELSLEAEELEENARQAEELTIDLTGEDRMFYLREPDVPLYEKREKLEAEFKDRLSVTMWSFLQQLLADGKTSYLPDILSGFIHTSKRHLGHVEARVKSAKVLIQSERSYTVDFRRKVRKACQCDVLVDEI